jgi:hippurate hydrolase
MGAEDFAEYGLAVPSAQLLMFRLGSVSAEAVAAAESGGPALPSIHSQRYAPVPAPTIKTGVLAMTAIALDALQVR